MFPSHPSQLDIISRSRKVPEAQRGPFSKRRTREDVSGRTVDAADSLDRHTIEQELRFSVAELFSTSDVCEGLFSVKNPVDLVSELS